MYKFTLFAEEDLNPTLCSTFIAETLQVSLKFPKFADAKRLVTDV